ncbi:hypothetical protein ACLQ8T_10465 [Glutamicibacter sp. FR1]|uniref:hypothetical protein n=1 Tax=Glutamicibacter sp. FR1 TaxID=3393744 RepID=UPI0039AFA30C
MITDEFGRELPVVQDLNDKISLNQITLNEAMAEADGEPDQQEYLHTLLTEMIRYQRAQIIALEEAVGTLESRVAGLQEATGISVVEYSNIRVGTSGEQEPGSSTSHN